MKNSWNHTKTTTQRGYGTQWQKLRKKILQRDNYLCLPCKQCDRLTAATQVDHIINKASGGTDDETNLQSICDDCHEQKTITERGDTIRLGCDVNGIPNQEKHHWNDEKVS